jgi:hypothetical protein
MERAMPLPSGDTLTAKDALAVIAALTIEERTKLFKALDYRPGLSRATGYAVLPRDIVDLLQSVIKIAVEREIEAFGLLKDLGNKLSHRNRRPSEARLERGKIVLEANGNGISWKNMPSHVLKTYPDWFPQYRDKRPSLEERKQLAEQLRGWARDAKKKQK